MDTSTIVFGLIFVAVSIAAWEGAKVIYRNGREEGKKAYAFFKKESVAFSARWEESPHTRDLVYRVGAIVLIILVIIWVRSWPSPTGNVANVAALEGTGKAEVVEIAADPEAEVDVEIVETVWSEDFDVFTQTRKLTFHEVEFEYAEKGLVEDVESPESVVEPTVEVEVRSPSREGYYGRPWWIGTQHPSHVMADATSPKGWRSAVTTVVSIYRTPVFTAFPSETGTWISSPHMVGNVFLPSGNMIQLIGPEGQETYVSFEPEEHMPVFFNPLTVETLYSAAFRMVVPSYDIVGLVTEQGQSLPYAERENNNREWKWHLETEHLLGEDIE